MKTSVIKFLFVCLVIALSGTANAQSDSTIVVKVKGLGCPNDVSIVESNVKALAGVAECKTLKLGATTSIEVRFDPSAVSSVQIFDAIEHSGTCTDKDARQFKVKK